MFERYGIIASLFSRRRTIGKAGPSGFRGRGVLLWIAALAVGGTSLMIGGATLNLGMTNPIAALPLYHQPSGFTESRPYNWTLYVGGIPALVILIGAQYYATHRSIGKLDPLILPTLRWRPGDVSRSSASAAASDIYWSRILPVVVAISPIVTIFGLLSVATPQSSSSASVKESGGDATAAVGVVASIIVFVLVGRLIVRRARLRFAVANALYAVQFCLPQNPLGPASIRLPRRIPDPLMGWRYRMHEAIVRLGELEKHAKFKVSGRPYKHPLAGLFGRSADVLLCFVADPSSIDRRVPQQVVDILQDLSAALAGPRLLETYARLEKSVSVAEADWPPQRGGGNIRDRISSVIRATPDAMERAGKAVTGAVAIGVVFAFIILGLTSRISLPDLLEQLK